MTVQEAVLIIQAMERARQGRLRAKFMKDIRQQEERERLAQQRGNQSDCNICCCGRTLYHMLISGAPSIDPEVAAVRVQKHWKGFAQRRRAKRERDDEMMFIGMVTVCSTVKLSLSHRM